MHAKIIESLKMTIHTVVLKIQGRLKWHGRQLQDWILSKIFTFPKVMTTQETIQFVVKNNLSISRFGDGELSLMYGKDLNFQCYKPELADKMKAVIKNENSKILVCIPDCFKKNSLNALCDTDKNFWKSHLMFFRTKWWKSLDCSKKYGNTWMSRIYSMKWDKKESENIFSQLEDLWRDRNVIMIEGAYSRLGVGNDCFKAARSINRILGPAKNSFDRYNEILGAAMSVEIENPLFILAMGPSATVMAYELAKSGRQAMDMGHLDVEYEWMMMNVRSKVPVSGKFSNEAFLTGKSVSEVTGDLSNEDMDLYKSQIIADFS